MPLFRIIRLKFGRRFGCLWAISLSAVWTSHAQLDPERRQLLLGHWNSGVGGVIDYTARNRHWRTEVATSYGTDVICVDSRGGYNLGMMFQYNLGPTTFASDRAFEELRNARVPICSL